MFANEPSAGSESIDAFDYATNCVPKSSNKCRSIATLSRLRQRNYSRPNFFTASVIDFNFSM
jgi:hypothetical protein